MASVSKWLIFVLLQFGIACFHPSNSAPSEQRTTGYGSSQWHRTLRFP